MTKRERDDERNIGTPLSVFYRASGRRKKTRLQCFDQLNAEQARRREAKEIRMCEGKKR
jgi:hypothetical protein